MRNSARFGWTKKERQAAREWLADRLAAGDFAGTRGWFEKLLDLVRKTVGRIAGRAVVTDVQLRDLASASAVWTETGRLEKTGIAPIAAQLAFSELPPRFVGKPFGAIASVLPIREQQTPYMDIRGSWVSIFDQAKREFLKMPAVLVAADGRRVLVHNPEKGEYRDGLSNRAVHLVTFDDRRHLDVTKARWLPVTPENTPVSGRCA